MSLKIGLTGNYLSGINDITASFKRYGIPVYDCDLMIKYLLYNSQEHIEKVRELFGEHVFNEGVIDVKKFDGSDESGELHFNVLLKLLYDDIKGYYETWRLKHKKSLYTIFKSNILYESGFHTQMDHNICVFRPIKFRATELYKFHSYAYEWAYKLLESEMEEKHKSTYSTYTIYNYDNYNKSVEDQISDIHNTIKNKVKVVQVAPGLYKRLDKNTSTTEYVD